MKPMRSTSLSVASGVEGTPETKEKPNRSCTHIIGSWFAGIDQSTHNIRQPFKETSVVLVHGFYVRYSRWILCYPCSPYNFARKFQCTDTIHDNLKGPTL